MKAEESSKSTFIGQFVYSINDIKYEWVDAIDFEDAISKLHSKSDWNNDRYDLNVFCSESYHQSQLQALKVGLGEIGMSVSANIDNAKDGDTAEYLEHLLNKIYRLEKSINNLEE